MGTAQVKAMYDTKYLPAFREAADARLDIDGRPCYVLALEITPSLFSRPRTKNRFYFVAQILLF